MRKARSRAKEAMSAL
jgi:predicted metal-dependent hydrolase